MFRPNEAADYLWRERGTDCATERELVSVANLSKDEQTDHQTEGSSALPRVPGNRSIQIELYRKITSHNVRSISLYVLALKDNVLTNATRYNLPVKIS